MTTTEKLARAINAYFEKHPPNFDNADSILDAIFWVYMESTPANSVTIRKDYAKLRDAWKLPPQEYDEILYITSDLCIEYSRLAFIEGIRLGVFLVQELHR